MAGSTVHIISDVSIPVYQDHSHLASVLRLPHSDIAPEKGVGLTSSHFTSQSEVLPHAITHTLRFPLVVHTDAHHYHSQPTVPITVAPRCFAHWQSSRPTPPAAAWTRIVSPGFTS